MAPSRTQTTENYVPNIIPLPARVHGQPGLAFLPSKWKLGQGHESFATEAKVLLAELKKLISKLESAHPDKGPADRLLRCTAVLEYSQLHASDALSVHGAEAYRLSVGAVENGKAGIRIQAASTAAAYYAGRSLVAILRAEGALRPLTIEDWPRFAWRGSMLDVSRHFFSVEYVLQHLERMAEAKLNVFHWHLTDDQGWRFQVPGFPQLTQTGAWRSTSELDAHHPDLGLKPGQKYGGFYSDADIALVLKRAQELHIMVIPELDIPGHGGAALSAYPALGCDHAGAPKLSEPSSQWGILDYFICPGKESGFEFVRTVVKRISELFPSPYIHIGGDEVQKVEVWEQCPACQKRMKDEKVKNGRELEAYFMRRACDIVREFRKIPMAWDDVLHAFEGRTAEDQPTVLQFWQSQTPLEPAIKGGYPVILSPATHVYLDMSYADPEPKRWAGQISLEKCYQMEPALFKVEDNAVRGIEAPLWSEHTATPELADDKIWPRLWAVSEAAWTPKDSRNWSGFVARLASYGPRMKADGISFRRSPEVDWKA